MKTAFELEAMITAEMLLLGECPIGLKLSVEGTAADWKARAHTEDVRCLAQVAQIEAKLRPEYDLGT